MGITLLPHPILQRHGEKASVGVDKPLHFTFIVLLIAYTVKLSTVDSSVACRVFAVTRASERGIVALDSQPGPVQSEYRSATSEYSTIRSLGNSES